MSIKQLVIVSILGFSSVALADDATTTATSTTTTTSATTTTKAEKDHSRMWTLQAAENHAAKSNDSKAVTDPGVWVTAQRDPHNKK
jgi:hypothetical protein